MTYTHKSLKPHRLWLILFSDNVFSTRYIPKTGGVNNLQANVAFTIFAPRFTPQFSYFCDKFAGSKLVQIHFSSSMNI